MKIKKYIVIIFIILICGLCIFCPKTKVQPFRLVVGGTMSTTESVVFDVYSNGFVSVKEFIGRAGNLKNDDFISDVLDKKRILLNNSDRKFINESIREIVKSNTLGGYDVGGCNIHILIDEQIYSSTFSFEDYQRSDKSIIGLTYRLMELAKMDTATWGRQTVD